MAPIQVDPQSFGRLEGKVDAMHEMLVRIHDGGSNVALANRINIRWVWSAVCGLAVVFWSGFGFLYHRIVNGG